MVRRAHGRHSVTDTRMLMALINQVVSNTALSLAIAAVASVAVAFSIYREWRKNQRDPRDRY